MLVDSNRLNQHHPWTVEEIAAAGRLHVDTVRRHIKDRLLEARRVGRRQWRITDQEARRYLGLDET